LGFTHGGAISHCRLRFAHACNFGDNVAVAFTGQHKLLKPSVEGDLLTAEAVRISDGKSTGIYQVTVLKDDKPVALFTGLAFKK